MVYKREVMKELVYKDYTIEQLAKKYDLKDLYNDYVIGDPVLQEEYVEMDRIYYQ